MPHTSVFVSLVLREVANLGLTHIPPFIILLNPSGVFSSPLIRGLAPYKLISITLLFMLAVTLTGPSVPKFSGNKMLSLGEYVSRPLSLHYKNSSTVLQMDFLRMDSP